MQRSLVFTVWLAVRGDSKC